MDSTPSKNNLNNSTLTPVRFLSSPLPSKDDQRAIRSRLKEIVKNLQDNQKKWEAAENRGYSLCVSIENIKSKALTNGSDLYPKELKPISYKLKVIFGIFEDVLENAKIIQKQIKALSCLSKNQNDVIFRTWNIKHYISFISKIIRNYTFDYEMKKIIKENICHLIDKSEIVAFTKNWKRSEHFKSDFLCIEAEIRCENEK